MPTLTLYFFPGTCARVSMIALNEAKANYDTELVNILTGANRSPEFLALNPAGKVPVLLIDGEPLTETQAILRYLNDHYPDANLLPFNGTPKHDRHITETFSWLNSTVQPLLTRVRAPMALSAAPESWKPIAQRGAEALSAAFAQIEARLANHPFIGGAQYSMFDVLAWWLRDQSADSGLDVSAWPRFAALAEKVAARPAVQDALAHEGATFGMLAAQGGLPPGGPPRFL